MRKGIKSVIQFPALKNQEKKSKIKPKLAGGRNNKGKSINQ